MDCHHNLWNCKLWAVWNMRQDNPGLEWPRVIFQVWKPFSRLGWLKICLGELLTSLLKMRRHVVTAAFSYFLYFTSTPTNSGRQMKWMLHNLLRNVLSAYYLTYGTGRFKKCESIWAFGSTSAWRWALVLPVWKLRDDSFSSSKKTLCVFSAESVRRPDFRVSWHNVWRRAFFVWWSE